MRIWFYPFSQTMPIPREYRDSFGVGGVKNQIAFLKFLSLTFSVKSYLFIFSLLLLLPFLEIEKWNDFSARNHSLKSQFPTSTYLTPGKQEGMKGGKIFFFQRNHFHRNTVYFIELFFLRLPLFIIDVYSFTQVSNSNFHLPHPRFRCEFHEGYNPLD